MIELENKETRIKMDIKQTFLISWSEGWRICVGILERMVPTQLGQNYSIYIYLNLRLLHQLGDTTSDKLNDYDNVSIWTKMSRCISSVSSERLSCCMTTGITLCEGPSLNYNNLNTIIGDPDLYPGV